MAEQIKMSDKEVDHWWKSISNRKKFMEPHHTEWRSNLDRYQLKNIDIPGLADDETVLISRIYPMVRKIIASIAFNYPEVFVRIEDTEDIGSEGLEDILNTAANDVIKVMDVRNEVHQGIFDAIFCYRPWFKIEYNKPGYDTFGVTSNNEMEDFPCVFRIDPFKILIDPNVKPHDYTPASDIIEEMDIPVKRLLNDSRFKHARTEIKNLVSEGGSDDFEKTFGQDMEPEQRTEDQEAREEAQRLAGIVRCYEVHDRIRGHRKFFVKGIKDPIENISHPFLLREAVRRTDPATGEELSVDYVRPSDENGEMPERFLLKGGFPYFTQALDLGDSFYGRAIASYEEQIESIIMDSLSHRADNLARLKRVIIGDERAKERDSKLPTSLKNAQDSSIVWTSPPPGGSVRDVLAPVDWGAPQPDQIQLERDALGYESQLIEVEARGGRTATESAINATTSELNREWMQSMPVNVYGWIVSSSFDIMADERYIPEEWYVSQRKRGSVDAQVAIQAHWLRVKRRVTIGAHSMSPFAEQMQRDSIMGFVDRFANDPFFDGKKLRMTAAQAFDFPDPEGLFRKEQNLDAIRSAQFELVSHILMGAQINPVQGEDHNTHMMVQNPQAVSQMPQFMNMLPAQQQQVIQLCEQHLQMHQEMINQEASGTGGPRAVSKPDSVSGATGIINKVRADAQENANLIQTQQKDAGVI